MSLTKNIANFMLGKRTDKKQNEVKKRNTIINMSANEQKAAIMANYERGSKSKKQREVEHKLKKMDPLKLKCTSKPMGEGYTDNLFGIVVPSGSGKTTMCELMGWIDVDACIPASHKEELWMDRLISLVETNDWGLSQEKWLTKVKSTIDAMVFPKATLILTHDYKAIEATGAQYLGSVMLPEEKNIHIKAKDGHYKTFLRLNNRVVESYPDVVLAQDHDDVLNSILDIITEWGICHPIPVGPGRARPPWFMADEKYGNGDLCDLEEIIELEMNGLISKECVNYQIKKRGKHAYKGYGKTMNDWAKIFSKVNVNIAELGNKRFEYKNFRKMQTPSIKEICRVLLLGDHEDIKLLIDAHEMDSMEFIVNVISHWKMFGVETDVSEILIKLYCVPEYSWNSMSNAIVGAISQSEDIMGIYLSPEDRETILGMRFVGCTDKVSLMRQILRPGETITRNVKEASPNKVLTALSTMKEDFDDEINFNAEQVDLTIKSNILNNVIELICQAQNEGKTKISEIADKSYPYTLKEKISAMMVLAMPAKWIAMGHSKESVTKIIIKNLSMIKFNLSSKHYIKDEWSEAIGKVLETKEVPTDACLALFRMMETDFSGATIDRDWDTRMQDCLKSMFVAGAIAEKTSGQSRIIGFKDKIPIVWESTANEITKAMVELQLPKHISKAYGEKHNEAVFTAQCISEANSNKSLYLISAINVNAIIETKDSKYRLAILANMVDRGERLIGWKNNYVLDLTFRSWYGREMRAEEKIAATNIAYSSREDNGLGALRYGKEVLEIDRPITLTRNNCGTLRDGTEGQRIPSIKNSNVKVKRRIIKKNRHGTYG